MTSDIRICFFGDSYTAGVGDPKALGWVGRISDNIHKHGISATTYNLGVRGNTSLDIEKRWQNEAMIRLPNSCQKYLIFSYGTNDTNLENGKQRVSFEETISATHHILKVAKNIAHTLLIGPPPVPDIEHNERNAKLDALLSEASDQNGITYISLYSLLEKNNDWINEIKKDDGYHPQSTGYDLLSQLIAQSDFWKLLI